MTWEYIVAALIGASVLVGGYIWNSKERDRIALAEKYWQIKFDAFRDSIDALEEIRWSYVLLNTGNERLSKDPSRESFLSLIAQVSWERLQEIIDSSDSSKPLDDEDVRRFRGIIEMAIARNMHIATSRIRKNIATLDLLLENRDLTLRFIDTALIGSKVIRKIIVEKKHIELKSDGDCIAFLNSLNECKKDATTELELERRSRKSPRIRGKDNNPTIWTDVAIGLLSVGGTFMALGAGLFVQDQIPNLQAFWGVFYMVFGAGVTFYAWLLFKRKYR